MHIFSQVISWGIIGHTLWEIWQMMIGMSHPCKIKGAGNLVDVLMDTSFFMAGLCTVYGIYWWFFMAL